MEVSRHDVPMTKRQKVAKTVFLVLVWVCIGLCLEITGPTLIDLRIKTGADYEEVAVAVSGRSVGYFIGSAIGGVLVDRWLPYCDLMIAACLTGDAVSTVFVPLCPGVSLMWFMIVLQGTFEGVINIAGQKLILLLWEKDAASPLHILHGGFGIGSFIIPLVANPFLAVPNPRYKDTRNLTESHSGLNRNVTESAGGLSSLFGTDATSANGIFFRNNTTVSANSGYMTTSKGESSVLFVDVYNTSFDEVRLGETPTFMANNDTFYNTEVKKYIRESQIEYAYLIAALITMVVACVFYVYHLRGFRFRKVKERASDKSNVRKYLDMVNPGSCTSGKPMYGVQLFTVLFLYYFNIVGGERILGKFIRAYAIEQLDFSVSDGSYINTAFWIGFAVGRISGFFVARYVSIVKIILIETSGIFVATVLLNVFAVRSSLALWILVQPLALFHAPCFPSMMGWADYHMEMSGLAITFLLLGGSCGGVAYLKITGFLFERFGPRAFLFHVLGYGVTSLVLAIVLTLIGRQHGSRFADVNNESESIEAEGEQMVQIQQHT